MRNPDMKFFGFFIGFVSLVFGIVYSISVWKTGVSDTPSNSGTVGLSILTLLIGINLLSLFFISDLNNYPKKNLFLLDK